MMAPTGTTKYLIDGLVASAGVSDPVSAIRLKATQAVDSFVAIFGEPDPFPLDLVALASFLGIKRSQAPPSFSPDAELAPDGYGGVEMRVNPDQPVTRRRFSIGHEITHTFFPEFTTHVWPRRWCVTKPSQSAACSARKCTARRFAPCGRTAG